MTSGFEVNRHDPDLKPDGISLIQPASNVAVHRSTVAIKCFMVGCWGGGGGWHKASVSRLGGGCWGCWAGGGLAQGLGISVGGGCWGCWGCWGGGWHKASVSRLGGGGVGGVGGVGGGGWHKASVSRLGGGVLGVLGGGGLAQGLGISVGVLGVLGVEGDQRPKSLCTKNGPTRFS